MSDTLLISLGDIAVTECMKTVQIASRAKGVGYNGCMVSVWLNIAHCLFCI